MTEEEVQSVGARIRSARSVRGLGSRALDRAAGLREGHVAMIEGRAGDIEGQTAAAIAKALDVSLEWLLSGEGEGPKAAPEPPSTPADGPGAA